MRAFARLPASPLLAPAERTHAVFRGEIAHRHVFGRTPPDGRNDASGHLKARHGFSLMTRGPLPIPGGSQQVIASERRSPRDGLVAVVLAVWDRGSDQEVPQDVRARPFRIDGRSLVRHGPGQIRFESEALRNLLFRGSDFPGT